MSEQLPQENSKKYRVTASKSESVLEHFETAQEAADRVTELLGLGFEYVHVIDQESDDAWL